MVLAGHTAQAQLRVGTETSSSSHPGVLLLQLSKNAHTVPLVSSHSVKVCKEHLLGDRGQAFGVLRPHLGYCICPAPDSDFLLMPALEWSR